MKISSRSAFSPGLRPPRSGMLLPALLAMACVPGCVADPGTPHAAAPASDPRALAADLDARLDALQHQAEPASDDVIASLEPVTGPVRTPMSRTPESHIPVDELYERARALEVQLNVTAAIGLYREASQRGHAPSSQRLMELYADGAPGVARDYRVAVFFKERAVQQGASFDPVWRH